MIFNDPHGDYWKPEWDRLSGIILLWLAMAMLGLLLAFVCVLWAIQQIVWWL